MMNQAYHVEMAVQTESVEMDKIPKADSHFQPADVTLTYANSESQSGKSKILPRHATKFNDCCNVQRAWKLSVSIMILSGVVILLAATVLSTLIAVTTTRETSAIATESTKMSISPRILVTTPTMHISSGSISFRFESMPEVTDLPELPRSSARTTKQVSRHSPVLQQHAPDADHTPQASAQSFTSNSLAVTHYVHIRLSDGGRPSRGRLEVLHNGTWGTVCHDAAWSNASALVACRQLNYTGLVETEYVPDELQSVDERVPIWWENVRCNGTESNLGDCSNGGWAVHSCHHHNDVHVRCTEPEEMTGVADTVVVGVKLAGRNVNLGRGSVQLVLANGSKASVHIGLAVSSVMSVICRQLNSSTPQASALEGTLDRSTNISNLWLVRANCLGNESSISQCHNLIWGCQRGTRCRSSEDALAIGCSSGQVTTVRPATTASSLARSTVADTRNASPLVQISTPTIGRGTSISNASARSSVAVRLSGGSAAWSGRVEVNRNGTWGVACGRNWNQRAAGVICRQLYGSEGNLTSPQLGGRVEPSLSTWSSNASCSWNETTLEDCTGIEFWTPSTCSSSDYIWVACDGPALRLVGGSSPDSGRLEVFYGGLWGLVCSSGFGPEDAAVACRQLGLGVASIYSNAFTRYWQGIISLPTDDKQPTWMSNVSCVGNESRLSDCPHSGWNISGGCSRRDDVALRCQPASALAETTQTATSASSTNERSTQTTAAASTLAPGPSDRGLNLQLVGSAYPDRGRLEILYNGVWGLVCSVGFDRRDATVACRQLGLGSGSPYSTYITRRFGGIATPVINESQPIWMSNVTCTGSELRLDECTHNGWNNTGRCSWSDDVAIHCEAPAISTIALQPTTLTSSRSTRNFVSSVVTTAVSTRTATQTARPTGVMTRTTGTRTETTETTNRLTTQTTRATTAILTTRTITPMTRANTATLTTRTITPMTRATTNTLTTRTTTATSRTSMEITRTNLFTTPVTTKGLLIMDTASAPDLRLVGGSDSTRGRLEVFYEGLWGLVCSAGFDNTDATVACRQLGYGYGSVLGASSWTRWFSGVDGPAVSQSTPIWMSGLSCNGSELYLRQCLHGGWNATRNCSLADDVAIQCRPLTTATALSTRTTTPRPAMATVAAGGSTRAAASNRTVELWPLRLSQPGQKIGILEVFYNNSWGAVCISESYEDYDAAAQLACRQLNFSTGYVHRDNWLPDNGYVLYDILCTGNELSLAECSRSVTPGDCEKSGSTLVVQCMDSVEDRMRGVRLVDGHDNSSGYVQLYVNGSWGSLCAKAQLFQSGWDLHDAEVLCRQLGIIRPRPRLLSSRRRIQSSLSEINFVADAFNCNGEEPTLFDCPRVQVSEYQSSCGNTTDHAVYAHCETLH